MIRLTHQKNGVFIKTKPLEFYLGLVIEGVFNEIMACCVIQSAINNNPNITKIFVVTSSKINYLEKIAKKHNLFLQIIEPSPWATYGVPPMNNGTFTTYFKFDLFAYIPINSNILYLDADTLILNPIDFTFIQNRIEEIGRLKENILLMVPSYRPVLEKLGNLRGSNPYCYYNAGVIFFLKKEKFDINMIIKHLHKFYENSNDLIWHDQDLINTYFAGNIQPLPFKYNLSTGFISVKASHVLNSNKNEFLKLKSPIIVHASGSILTKKWKYYPFRKDFEGAIDVLLQCDVYSRKDCYHIADFRKQVSQKFVIKAIVYLKLFLVGSKECSRNFYPVNLSMRFILKKAINR